MLLMFVLPFMVAGVGALLSAALFYGGVWFWLKEYWVVLLLGVISTTGAVIGGV